MTTQSKPFSTLLDHLTAAQFSPLLPLASLAPTTTDGMDSPEHPVHDLYTRYGNGTYDSTADNGNTGNTGNTGTDSDTVKLEYKPDPETTRVYAVPAAKYCRSVPDIDVLLTGAPAPSCLSDAEWHQHMDSLYGPLETVPTLAERVRALLFALLFSCVVYVVVIGSIVGGAK